MIDEKRLVFNGLQLHFGKFRVQDSIVVFPWKGFVSTSSNLSRSVVTTGGSPGVARTVDGDVLETAFFGVEIDFLHRLVGAE